MLSSMCDDDHDDDEVGEGREERGERKESDIISFVLSDEGVMIGALGTDDNYFSHMSKRKLY